MERKKKIGIGLVVGCGVILALILALMFLYTGTSLPANQTTSSSSTSSSSSSLTTSSSSVSSSSLTTSSRLTTTTATTTSSSSSSSSSSSGCGCLVTAEFPLGAFTEIIVLISTLGFFSFLSFKRRRNK